MQKQVFLVLRLYDDFTGSVLSGKAYSFKINHFKVTPIIKTDGYFVFLGRPLEDFKLTIESLNYETVEMMITLNNLKETGYIKKIRLLPGAHYYDSRGKNFKGKIRKGNQEIWFIPQNEKPYLKYGGGCKEDASIIRINSLKPCSILNLNLMPAQELEIDLKTFYPIEKRETNIYKLNDALTKSYEKSTELIRVYRARTKQDGSYSIWLDNFYDTNKFVLVYKNKKIIRKEIEV